jgi:uncharacterized protein with PIN domain
MKFIADAMLGRLVTWMRVIGCDVAYVSDIEDEELVNMAHEQGRMILTRDTLLIQRRRAKQNYYFIDHDDYRDQLRQVVSHFGIDPYLEVLTRCLRCNAKLVHIDRDTIKHMVPPYVYETQQEFKTCPSCRRIYWGATHKEEMLRQLKDMLEDDDRGDNTDINDRSDTPSH